MASLYDTLKDFTSRAAESLALPLAWEGEPLVVPASPHARARIVVESMRAATPGKNGLTRESGMVEVKVFTPAGQDSEAARLARDFARLFPRGTFLLFDGGEGRFVTPGISSPAADGKRVFAAAALNYYAHYKA